MTRALILPCLAGLLLVTSSVRAQSAEADALYAEAGELMKANRFAEACPKLETSQRLDPGIGSLIRLAFCYESVGRTASSWSAYHDAEALAARANDKRADEAAARAKALEPKLSRLSIAPADSTPGLVVLRDGKPMDPGLFGTAVPVDPGQHIIEASAPGRQPWKTSAQVSAAPGTTSIAIPVLLAGAPTEAPLAGADAGRSGGSVQRTVGFTAIGVGAAVLVVGAITLGLDASKHASLLQQCPIGQCMATLQPQLQGDVSSYHTLGAASSTSLIAGGVLAAMGVILVAVAPKTNSRAAGVSPVLGLGYAGLSGRFQ